LLCEAELGDDETDSEVMLVESEESETQETSKNNKRPHSSNGEKSAPPPPSKKMREGDSPSHLTHTPNTIKNNSTQKGPMQRHKSGTNSGGHVTNSQNARVSAPAKNTPGTQRMTGPAGTFRKKQLNPSQRGRSPATQSVTWKYKKLDDNTYTADIKKSEVLKDYEVEKCECKPPEGGYPPGKLGCRSGCHNRAIYVECDKDHCSNGDMCGNRVIQQRQYAPGLERFMTREKGWGVRARQAVASGSFILEYTGEIVSMKEFEKRMLSRYEGDEHHYCLALDSKHMIDAHRAGSECRFVNHSCDPNCEMMKWNVKGLYRMALFAKKDILAGEEICYDYNFSLFDSDKGQSCHCGAAECRGVIGGKNKDFVITMVDNSGQKTTQSTATDPTIQLKVDEKWFNQNISPEELTWFQRHAPKPHQLASKHVKCTVCNEQLNHAHLGQIQRHPALGVVMCNVCRKKYSKVSWDKSEEEENDDSCRWCTEGGNIFLCDFCPNAFCKKCIKWNLGRKFVKDLESSDQKWKCLLCDTSPLKSQRALYWAVHQYHKNLKPGAKTKVATPVKNTPNKKKVNPIQTNANPAQVRGTPPTVNGRSPVRFMPKSPGMNARSSPGPANAMARLKHNSGISILPAAASTVNHKPMNSAGVNRQIGRVVMNGSREPQIPKHWLEKMLKEVEDTADHMKNLIRDIRHGWTRSKRGESDETENTRKLRQVLQIQRKNIEDMDKTIINEYRMNREDADLRDIAPEQLDKIKHNERLKMEKEIFSKSSLEDANIDGVVCMPDMSFMMEVSDDEVENVESTPDLVNLDEESTDNDSDGVIVDSEETGNSESDSGKEGRSSINESELESGSDGEVKVMHDKNKNMSDEASEEQSEVDESNNTDNDAVGKKTNGNDSNGINEEEEENKLGKEMGDQSDTEDKEINVQLSKKVDAESDIKDDLKISSEAENKDNTALEKETESGSDETMIEMVDDNVKQDDKKPEIDELNNESDNNIQAKVDSTASEQKAIEVKSDNMEMITESEEKDEKETNAIKEQEDVDLEVKDDIEFKLISEEKLKFEADTPQDEKVKVEDNLDQEIKDDTSKIESLEIKEEDIINKSTNGNKPITNGELNNDSIKDSVIQTVTDSKSLSESIEDSLKQTVTETKSLSESVDIEIDGIKNTSNLCSSEKKNPDIECSKDQDIITGTNIPNNSDHNDTEEAKE